MLAVARGSPGTAPVAVAGGAALNLNVTNAVLLAGAGFAAGGVNAVAGGGSLLSFPALLFVGAPALTANVTNQVAQCFGYVGGVSGYRNELTGQAVRLRRLGIDVGIGSLAGVVLLHVSSPATFEAVVPWLLFFACVLLLIQPRIATAIGQRGSAGTQPTRLGRFWWILDVSQVLAGAYGAYFGGGLGVMLLALLGILIGDNLQRLNALKAYLSLVVGVLAAVCFAITAPVQWTAVALIGPTSLIGGGVGATMAQRLDPDRLRLSVAFVGIAVAAKLLLA